MLAPSRRSWACSCCTRSGGRCGWGISGVTPPAATAAARGGTSTSTCSAAVEFQHSFGVTFKFALMTVPDRLGARRRAGGARRQADPRARPLPDRLLVHRRHLRRRRLADVVLPAAARSRRARRHRLVEPSSRRQEPRPAAATRAPRCGRWRSAAIWANLGFTFILVTAGLQSIPRDCTRAPIVDGAGGWTRFTNVTLPMLSPTLLFAIGGAHQPGVPGLRRDRPARPAAARPVDHHDGDVPDLRRRSVITADSGLQAAGRRAAVPRAAHRSRSSSSAASSRRVHYARLTALAIARRRLARWSGAMRC